MNLQMRYSTPADLELLLDTADRIFTAKADENGEAVYQKGYFLGLQPKLYERPELLSPHLLVFDGERLVGLAGISPKTMHIGKKTLTVCGLGTVGVLAEYRGQGIMKLLMDRLNADMARDSVDIAELGGCRKRYARYGYFTGSAAVDLEFCPEDLCDEPELDIAFEGILATFDDELKFFSELHGRHLTFIEREPAAFLSTLRTGGRRAMRILFKGETLGYASISSNGSTICEIELSEPSYLPSVLRAYLARYSLGKVTLHNFSPHAPEVYRSVAAMASATAMRWSERYRIFNYPRVLEVGLSARQTVAAIPEGELVLGIRDQAPLTVSVRNRAVEVTETPQATPTLQLTEEEATLLLLGASASLSVYPEELPELARAWFPLPFHVNSNDRI